MLCVCVGVCVCARVCVRVCGCVCVGVCGCVGEVCPDFRVVVSCAWRFESQVKKYVHASQKVSSSGSQKQVSVKEIVGLVQKK